MANNKICCDETKVEATLDLNDRDYLNDILYNEKTITINTATALTEASNEKLQKEIFNIFETVKNLQAETYELAWNLGWYTLEEAQDTKVKQKEKELIQKLDEFSK